MTTTELCDRLAEAMEWRYTHKFQWVHPDGRVIKSPDQPCPPTLDAASAIIRERGYKWRRYEVLNDANDAYRGLKTIWYGANPEKQIYLTVPDTNNEAHDLLALALKVVEAGKERKT